MTASPGSETAGSGLSYRGVACGCFLAAAALFALDGLLFRSGLYTSYLEPESSTGTFETILRIEQDAQKQFADNLVVTLGDSRFAYYPRVCRELASQTGYIIRSACVAGSDLRSWYYMLRDLDPTRRRYRAVVMGMSDYEDEDEIYDPYTDLSQMHYVAARLRCADSLSFARSYRGWQLQWQALRSALFKGFLFQSDLHAFLSDPIKRIDYVPMYRRGIAGWMDGFVDSKASLAGLSIDWSTMTATFPPQMDAAQRDSVQSVLLREVVPQTGRLASFRREWLHKIIDGYRGSRTRIVFLRLPRGPSPRPAWLVSKKSSSIREFADRPNVRLMDDHLFDILERPELYKDALHLNDEGATRFSRMLAEEIAKMLGPAG